MCVYFSFVMKYRSSVCNYRVLKLELALSPLQVFSGTKVSDLGAEYKLLRCVNMYLNGQIILECYMFTTNTLGSPHPIFLVIIMITLIR